MKTIVLFGAGKSATVLIEYLLKEAELNNWRLIVADANKDLVLQKTNHHPYSEALAIDSNDAIERMALIRKSDVVISMMPPSLHILIAKDCIVAGKHLLTASYIDDAIRQLEPQLLDKNLLFLCEMGLDPGIDHMSAMKVIDQLKAKGAVINTFRSHCGGLVAPESDDNPWHYKISWNPRNVVLAGKSGAIFKENGKEQSIEYEQLFDPSKLVTIDQENQIEFSYYPNRNSLPYISLYLLPEVSTFIRTTLRHPFFMSGWKQLIQLKLTDETVCYDTNEKSIHDFFKEHLGKYELGSWFKIDTGQPGSASILSKDDVLFFNQLQYLGLNDNQTLINKGMCSAADVLQFILETKLALQPNDKDMIVMLHEIGYSLHGKQYLLKSALTVTGRDQLHTAMAKTVGLPLGIAATLILKGELLLSGVHLPIIPQIYQPVLQELEKLGIVFQEYEVSIN